jgi:murein L,D-transpeptidase YcbB/YkuD
LRASFRIAIAFCCAAAVPAAFACAQASAAEPDGPKALIGRAEIITIAVQNRLSERVGRGAEASEPKALLDFYADPEQKLLWVDENGLTSRANAVMEEIGHADDYGLKASDYSLPKEDGFDKESQDAVDWLAEAEIKLGMAVLRYARDARGGRIDPQRLSPNLDPTLALPDPLQVMESIAIRSDPAIYLRSFQPDQPQFEALRAALMAARGGTAADDNVLRIPEGPVLKLGVEDEQVALLRKRLQIPAADESKAKLFDEQVADAVRRFQEEKGVYPDGLVGPGTRRLLNGQQQATASPARIRQILINMERWRWLPNDLGSYYVTVNIPEFVLRVMDDGKPVFVTRVVVGKPDTQTPIFTNEMQTIVFGPFWTVPNSIRMNELLPAIRAGGDWFFGGGGYYDTSVFDRNGLRVSLNGREIDPSRLDWSRVDIRAVNVYQPPGPDNVLGNVKFLFPNKHDVYMHDTTQKTLFAKTVRAESHGCMRVQNPDQFAAIILKRDQNWSAGEVDSAFNNSHDRQVPLRESIPVYINYFTLWVNDDGSLSTFTDIYGHDARMAAALFGEPMPFDALPYEEASSFPVGSEPVAQQRRARRVPVGRNHSIADSLSNFLNN